MELISRDTLWKGIIEDLFEDFLYYFYPIWADQEVDFGKPFEFLDKELDEISLDKTVQKRYADKLIKVFTKNQEELWILVHIEVQGYEDADFAERMFAYFYRIRDKYKKKVMALAILTDKNPDFLPSAYHYDFQETSLTYRFKTFKLLNQKEEDLDIKGNPFSIVMLTAFKALQKNNLTDKKIFEWKIDLVRKLAEAGYESIKIRRIMSFISLYVKFKNQSEESNFETEALKYTKNRKNMGIEEAIIKELTEKALEKGEKLGLEKGEKLYQEKLAFAVENLLKIGLQEEVIAKSLQVSQEFMQYVKQKMN